jgi:hypothetical protein
MVTKSTGRQRGRPKVALRDFPLRYELALSEALRRGLEVRRGFKVSHQVARALAVVALRAKKTDDGGKPPPKLLRKREKTGGEIVYFDISTLRGGDLFERDPSKRIQAINTLERKAKRGIEEADQDYLMKLSTCFYAALFGNSSLETRAKGIDLLSQEIGETAFGAALIEAMLTDARRSQLSSRDATSDIPDYCPVGARFVRL